MWGKLFSIGLFFSLTLLVIDVRALTSNELLTSTDSIHKEIQNPQVFNAKTCADYIQNRGDRIRSMPFDYYFPQDNKSNFKNYAQAVVEKVFDIRLILKNKLTEFYNAKTLTLECTAAIRQGMRVARTAEEMVLAYQLRNDMLPPIVTSKKSNGTLLGDYPQTIKNPKFYNSNQEVELKSGDILLMRGIAVVSALIARVGDEDAMFSHIGVFYIHPETKKKYIIESLIETGFKITPYEEWMEIVESRVALYRHPMESVATDAAQKLYDYFENYKVKNGGRTIPYDFEMNLNNYNKMFCSEVARLGYELATNGAYKLPTFITSAKKIEKSGYLKQLGVKGTQLFSPNDMEIEPGFELVAEFRRIDRLMALRTYDIAMQAIFDWMYEYNYKLKVSALGILKNKFGKMIDNIGLKDYGIPKGMPAKTIETMALTRMLQKDVLIAHLDKFEKEYAAQNGEVPSHQDLMKELNEFRKKDCLNYKNRKTVKAEVLFHHYFSPDNLTCD